MILKKSMGNIFRSKAKSILFLLLIFLATSVLAASLGVWISVDDFLDKCDDNYKTIAVLEYMGTDYPDDTVLDEKMQESAHSFDYSLIENNENVLLWDRSEKAIGYVDGYTRTDIYAPYKDGAVLVIGDILKIGRYGAIGTIVQDSIYSLEDNTNMMVLVENPDFDWEKDHYYLVHGDYVLGKTSYNYIKLRDFENDTAEKNGFTDWNETKIQDITTPDGGYETDPGSIFYKIAQTYKVINNSLMVTETSDLYSLLPFNQQQLYIKYGRDFTSEEYKDGAAVCIVSEAFASKMNYSVGDKINLSIAVSADTAPYESYWVDSGFQYENEYEIVGITNNRRELESSIFIPSDNDMDLSVNQIGYTLGQAVLKNGTAGEFYSEISPQLADRMRLSIYDQGYSQVAEPFKDIRRLAQLVSAACMLTVLSVLVLFGFSFVYRQREVSDIMVKLGAGKSKVYRYFLYSSGILSLVAATGGASAAYLLSGRVTELVKKMAEGYALSDKSFSVGNLSIVKTLEFSPDMHYFIFLAIAGAVLLISVLSCMAYVRQTFRVRRKRKKVSKSRAGHTIRLPGAGLKYAVASIARGGARTLVVPMVCALAVVFLGQLASTTQSYRDRLDDIGRETEIRGHFTDINGKLTDNVLVDSFMVRDMYASGYIDDILCSKALDFYYHGIYAKNGEPTGLEPLVLPKLYAFETFMDHLRMGPDIVYTNSLESTPEFFYSNSIEADYMEGYDESFFTLPEAPEPLCIVSKTMMKDEGIEYGDSISVFIPDFPDYDRRFMNLKVVGSFVKDARESNIYCQIKGYYDFDALFDKELDERRGIAFDAVDFRLVSAGKVDEFKEWLKDYGISEPTRISKYRSFVVLEDIQYDQTVDMLKQQIRYINVLYPFLYVLVGLVAIIISYLMVVNRRKEFAIMRGLGAGRFTAFVSFFFEQSFLCIIGSALGFLVHWIASGVINNAFIFLSAGFVVLYLVGSILSIMIMNNINVSAILKYED